MTPFPYKHKIAIAAHRGDKNHVPENTIAAFRAAIDKGADMLELDVHMTADGEIIVMHDPTVDRTTNGTGKISELTLAEIRALSAGEYKGEILSVPTFREFCELVKPYDELLLNVEFKDYYHTCGEAFCRESLEKTIAIIEEYGLADRTVMNSFDAYILGAIAKMDKGYRIHGFYPYTHLLNVSEDPTPWLYCACMFDYEEANAQFLKDHGIEVWLGAGVVTEEQFARGIDLGAVLFTTNDPAEAIRITKKLGGRD